MLLSLRTTMANCDGRAGVQHGGLWGNAMTKGLTRGSEGKSFQLLKQGLFEEAEPHCVKARGAPCFSCLRARTVGMGLPGVNDSLGKGTGTIC